MRRLERERNDTGGRGFRILEAGGRYLEPLTPPPPPRAPEPYKVAPTSSSLGRAHRRSSFVIIAETRPATPGSRSPSPTLLATGRVSPFRGRGFKGPLPHAQSRPQSPENHQHNGRKYARYDRRASVSQQNSPKRSLIPQPTRQRSISLPKNNERKASPKFGRRATPIVRKNSTVANGNIGGNISRRQSLKAPDLSPIQGTPTKPTEGINRFRGGNSLVAKGSPVKSRNTLTVPKNGPNPRRVTSHQDRSPIKATTPMTKTKRFVEEKKSNGENESPTKIPMRRGSIVNKNGSTQSLSTSRFVGKNVKPPARAAKDKIDKTKSETNSTVNENREIPDSRVDEKKDDGTNEDSPGSRFIDMNLSSDSKKHENDLGLIDLLKQSSGATGTSSVVNTTTTTAVQPLQIEAAGILLENDRAKTVESVNTKSTTVSPSPASLEVSPSPGPSPGIASEPSSLPKSPKAKNGNPSTGTSEKKGEIRENEVTNSLGTSSTTPVMKNASQKVSGRGNVEESNKKESNNATNKGQTSRDKTLVGGSSKKNLLTRNGVQDGSRGEMRLSSANPGSRVNNTSNNGTNNSHKSKSSEQTVTGRVESNTATENVVTTGKLLAGKPAEAVTTSLTSGHRKSDSRDSAKSTNGTSNDDDLEEKRTPSRNVGVANTKNNETNNVQVAPVANGDNNKFHTNRGSESSLKSSNGLSSVSVESIRSTDTGVSVNTVRGVSSAREKKGIHMMKRSEEIETLSGNVMQLERNGEPAVLDIAEAAENPQEQTRLGRFKKSLARFNDRLPSMRCLGCRRNQKGHAWLGERGNQAQGMQSSEAGIIDANPGNSRCNRMWSRLKNACRCTRLRECKCCRRAARVAPAESTPCCPPERRCGALCRRLFSRCKCNRSEAQHTRSIRAKHSLTSVAPPPLSEEQRAKIPEVLVEHNSVMRGAIPCLPVPIAWFCLVWNVLLPGSGTVWSGLFNLCIGQPRFSVTAGPRARFGSMIVNLFVGVGQFFTVLFCLVGWGWSIWWGVTMIRLARKYKRFRASEAASSDPEARGGEPTGLPPGVPSQALRGMERAR